MFKSYKFRLYPTREQEVLLSKHFGCSRFIYNWGLDKKVEYYTKEKKSYSTHQLMKDATILKKDLDWLKEVNSQSIQQSLWDLDTAFKNFFNKQSNFPKFKSKKNNKNSFHVPQFLEIDFKHSKINVPKFKDGIKIIIHRNIEGLINSGTISKNGSGKYYLSTMVELKDPVKIIDGEILGIDFGVKTFMTFSNGVKIERKDFLYLVEKRLSFLQKKLSKKKLGSKNREKIRKKIAILSQKTSNRREDFLHKLTTKIVENKDYNFVGIEDLNIVGMMKNRSLSKRIGDLSWNKTTEMLKYKLERVGKSLIKIGRFEPSSKLCSCCGKKNNELTLSQREWTCSCGTVHDRDINAAINIKNFAHLSKLGREPSDVKSVEKLTSADLRKMIGKLDSVKQKKYKGETKVSTLKPTVL